MPEAIYIVDPVTKEPKRVEAVSFHSIGIKERSDLEEWVIRHPQMLGEDLLVITSEFDRFDKSNKRLDVLALDKTGKLVVVELKLDARDSLAELQAIRYAAFCSTMTLEDVTHTLAQFTKVTPEEATRKIREFLDTDELPELDNKPRIIIAAGSIDDTELSSTALWLRTFEIDISCVELTPYKLSEPDRVILVPRTVIPPPEAKEYMVSVIRKEAAQNQAKIQAAQPGHLARWKAIIAKFAEFNTGITPDSPKRQYTQIQTGIPGVHWEWLSFLDGKLDVALHFECPSKDINMSLCKAVEAHRSTIEDGIGYPLERSTNKTKWADLHFRIVTDTFASEDELVAFAAKLMSQLIERTHPILKAAAEA